MNTQKKNGKQICEVLDITDNDKLISIELGVAKVTPQIH